MAGTHVEWFASADLKMRYREPYVTEGLNAKLANVLPAGTYRGFRLSIHAANQTVTVQRDHVSGDNVAVFTNDTNHSLTIRRDGNVALDLSPFAGKTVVIAIYGSYALGAATAAEFRAYELSPVDEFTTAAERPQLVVLGTVVVPAGAVPIPAGDITCNYRTEAWQNIAPQEVIWVPVCENPRMTDAVVGDTQISAFFPWATLTFAPQTIEAVDTDADAQPVCAEFEYTGGAGIWTLQQLCKIPVREGQLLKVVFEYKALKVADPGAVALASPFFVDVAGVSVPVDPIVPDVFTVSTDFITVERTYKVPATAATLIDLGFGLSATYSVAGRCFRVRRFQAWLETGSPEETAQVIERKHRIIDTRGITISTAGNNNPYDPLLMATESGGNGVLVGGRRDMSATAWPVTLLWPGTIMGIGGQMITPAARAEYPRLASPISQDTFFTLMWEFTHPVGGQPRSRLYATNGGLLFTSNARWDTATAQWNKDVLGQTAAKIVLNNVGIAVEYRAAVANAPWLNTAWSIASFGSGELGGLPINAMIGSLGMAVLSATTPRIVMATPAAFDWNLLLDFGPVLAAGRHYRLYMRNSGPPSFYLVTNAKFDEGTNEWIADVAGQVATRYAFNSTTTNSGEDQFLMQTYWAGAASWPEAFWTDTVNGDTNHLLGRAFDAGAGGQIVRHHMSGVNDIPNGAWRNSLGIKNILKMWASVYSDAATLPSLIDGFNVSLIVAIGPGGSIILTPAWGFSAPTYGFGDGVAAICSGTCDVATNNPVLYDTRIHANGAVEIMAFDPTTGAQIDLTALGGPTLYIDLVVAAPQT